MTKEFCDICGRSIETQPDGKIMNKRRGRPPKNDKRDNSYRLRLNAEERQMLEQISEQTEQPIATVIRKAVLAYYEAVNMKEKEHDSRRMVQA